jgi:hypothetical protein
MPTLCSLREACLRSYVLVIAPLILLRIFLIIQFVWVLECVQFLGGVRDLWYNLK